MSNRKKITIKRTRVSEVLPKVHKTLDIKAIIEAARKVKEAVEREEKKYGKLNPA